MIVDSSVIVAIVLEEPGHDDLLDAVVDAEGVLMSAATALESSIVLDGRGGAFGRKFDALCAEAGIAIVPVTATHFDIARQAYGEYGRGSGSRARLDFGDCFSYALAIEQDDELLFVGDDFTHTDVRPALAS